MFCFLVHSCEGRSLKAPENGHAAQALQPSRSSLLDGRPQNIRMEGEEERGSGEILSFSGGGQGTARGSGNGEVQNNLTLFFSQL